MKKILKISCRVIMLFSLMFYVGCSKETNTTEDVQPKNLNLLVFGKNQTYYNHTYGELDLHSLKVEKIINGDLVTAKDNFAEIVEDVLKQYNIKTGVNDLKSITFYGKDINLRVDNRITGFSLIRYTEQGFYQEMYKIKNGIASLDAEFSREYHTTFFIKSFAYFSHKIADENNSVLTIFNSKSSSKFRTKSGHNEYEIELAALEQFPIIDLSAVYDKGCTVSDCGSDRVNGYCSSAGSADVVCHAQTPRGKICPKDETQTPKTDGQNEDEIQQMESRVAMYDIRDNILSLSTKGQQYVDFYYKLGYVFKVTNAYVDLSTEMKDLMRFIDEKSILFITANSSTVMINNNEASYLKKLIVKFRTLTTNVEYQFILSTLESDLSSMTNKTKLDILGTL